MTRPVIEIHRVPGGAAQVSLPAGGDALHEVAGFALDRPEVGLILVARFGPWMASDIAYCDVEVDDGKQVKPGTIARVRGHRVKYGEHELAAVAGIDGL